MYARHLLANGADANAVDDNGRTAAFEAVSSRPKAFALEVLLPHMNDVQILQVMEYSEQRGTAETSAVRQELERRASSVLIEPRNQPPHKIMK